MSGTLLVVILSWVPALAAPPGAAPLSDATRALDDLGRQVQDRSLPEADRLQIIQDVLGRWASSEVRPPLLAVLKDPSESIRAAAARALGWPGNREAVGSLRERIEAENETASVRAAALEALGRIGDESVRGVALTATKDPDAKVRSAALWAVTLGSLQSETDRVGLLRQAAADQSLDLFLRSQSILTLGRLHDTGAVDILMRLLEHEPPIPMPMPKDPANQRETMMVRYRQARDVRAWSAAALGVLEAKEALPLLLTTAEDQGDFFLRLTSVQTLVAWQAPGARPVLIRSLGDPFPEVRILALVGLSRGGDSTLVDPVLTLLADPYPGVRAQAVKTLADLGDPRVRPQLEALEQRDPDSSVQEAVEKALARLGR